MIRVCGNRGAFCASHRAALAALATVFVASSAVASPIILNNSFELPSIGTGNGSYSEGNAPTDWAENPTGNGTSGGGIVGNGSAYGNTNAPDGTQALLLKSQGGVEQTLSGFSNGGSYTLSLWAEARANGDGFGGPDVIQVLMDGTPLTFSSINTISPVAGSYTFYTSDTFTVGSSTPLLLIKGITPGDQSSFVDLVTVSAVPEPSSVILIALGAVGLLALSRRRKS